MQTSQLQYFTDNLQRCVQQNIHKKYPKTTEKDNKNGRFTS